MLKILIVDDDMLTRKGIRMMMPWAAHQMEIIGEAANGKEALDFLAAHPETDLALVDLDMPVMNGTTFIEEASKRYPDLSYVVLTVHTEFEYIQQILRLGAIDYIAKTQFDRENFDQILDRIQAGISKKNHASASAGNWKESKILYPDMYALLSINTEEEESEFSDFLDANRISEADVYELQQNIWVFHDTRQTFAFPDSFAHSMLLNVSDVYEMTYAQFGKLLRHYLKDQFFYDYRPLHDVNHKHAYELEETTMITDLSTFDAMKSEWSSLNWIHENELFDQFRATLKNCCLKPSQLYHFLLNLEILWNASYSTTTGETIKLPSSFSNWYEVEQWLLSVYEKAKLFRADSKYSREIVKNILSVQSYIHANYGKELDATELARSVGMSYGYFSRCFHDIVGQSFSEYCISVRMKEAQLLLKNTDDSVQSIAFSVGYHDEKYFSRLFKKVTGQSPSDYRKN